MSFRSLLEIEMKQIRIPKDLLFVTVAIIASTLMLVSTSNGDHESPTFQQLATTPKAIFIGRVVDVTPERTSTDFIVSNITFQVDHLVCGKLGKDKRLIIRQLGGTMDDQIVSVCCQPQWEVGGRYLVFAEDPDALLSSPTLGALEGVFHVVKGSDGLSYPLAWGYRPITGLKYGHLSPSVRATSVEDGRATLYREPITRATPIDTSEHGNTVTAIPTETTVALTLDEMLELIYQARNEEPKPYILNGHASTIPAVERGSSLCGCGYADLYRVMEQVPESWTSFSYNNSMMARFNKYFDVFRYSDDDGGWNAPNGESEICGWIDSDTLEDVYGDPSYRWSSGGRGLCVTWSGSGCDEISEADIFLNPDKTFVYTLDDSFGTTDQWHFQKTMIHEMGHAIGFETGSCGTETYQYNRPTIMYNNQTYHVEGPVGLHRRDAKLLNMLYGDQGTREDIEDMGVESYYADGSITNSTLNPTTVQQGDSFTIENVFVENMSDSSVSGVRLRVYLSENRTITTNDHLVGGYTNFGTFSFDDDWRGDVSRTVSYGVDPGTYYVGLMLTTGGSDYDYDDWSSNNTTWVATQLTVTEGDGLFNDAIMMPLSVIAYHGVSFWADTSGADDDPDPPYCPGVPPMGPSLFWQIDIEDDGELEVGIAEAAEPAEGYSGEQGVTDVVAIYELNSQGSPTEIVGLSCSTNINGPAIAHVLGGKSYQVRIGGQGDSPTAGWYEAFVKPNAIHGSNPKFPISLSESRPWSTENMPQVTFSLPCAQSSTHGMWFRIDAETNGLIEVTTCSEDTDFASVISVHKDNEELPLLRCSSEGHEDCGTDFGATTSWVSEAGETYLIRVGSLYPDNPGTFRLDFRNIPEPTSNYKCEIAMPIQEGNWSFNTAGAQGDGAMLCNGDVTSDKSAWFGFTAETSGILKATTCPDLGGGAQTGTTVTMFDSCSNAASACDNLHCDGVYGGAYLRVDQGETIFIRVAGVPNGVGYSSVSGSLRVTLELGCVGDLDGNDRVNIADLLELIAAWGECNGCAADFNSDGKVAVDDLLVLIGAWGDCP